MNWPTLTTCSIAPPSSFSASSSNSPLASGGSSFLTISLTASSIFFPSTTLTPTTAVYLSSLSGPCRAPPTSSSPALKLGSTALTSGSGLVWTHPVLLLLSLPTSRTSSIRGG